MAKQQYVLATESNPAHSDTARQPQQQPSNTPKEMQRFSATRTVRAAKLSAVDRNPDGTITLIPEDSAFAHVQLGPNEAANIKGFGSSDPSRDYGYAVIDDNGRREWMSSADFEMYFGKK